METETKNHDALGEQPGNQRIVRFVLIAIGLLLGMVVWNDRAKNQLVVYVEQLLATDDADDSIFYDSRGAPYYYASDPAGDSARALFYFDTPVNRPSERATPGSY